MVLDLSHSPTFGVREAVITSSVGSEQQGVVAFFGNPTLADNLGDRVVDVRIHNVGNFDNTSISLDVNFTGLHRPDLNKDGLPDFVEATLSTSTTQRLVSFVLDGNGIFEDEYDVDDTVPGNEIRSRSLYLEEPNVNFLLTTNRVSDENESTFTRLRSVVDYDPSADKSFFDLYIDDRLPETFFYGFLGDGSLGKPAMGSKITITEGLPGMNWAKDLSSSYNQISITDQNGYYAFTGLDPGLYNVAVLMEDKNFQESTFRTEANSTHVTEVLYVPGLPNLVLESDQRVPVVSRMVWSRESRDLARPSNPVVNEANEEIKRIEGVGLGFNLMGMYQN